MAISGSSPPPPSHCVQGAIIFPSLLDFVQPYQAVLTGANQVPPVVSTGAGVFLASRPYTATGTPYIANTFVTFMAADGLNGTQTLVRGWWKWAGG